ncbi:membrane protein [Xylocopilactobacillus apicola]|uniref:Diadenylate cyclase n=2 Tax=Xylocopilactobacillus apicola TaxID=2932184 RepID=A0AAU9DXB2_9LACO|nr:membrane protein [Xylocopilactobacillus apicola]
MIRGTKATQLLRGIAIIVVLKVISWYFNFKTLNFISDQVINWAVVVLVIIFQPEIRRGLEQIGRGSVFTPANVKDVAIKKRIDEIDTALQYMATRRIGALITLQGTTGLEEYTETGIQLDALITNGLLINIFIPNTPLHDGAVIIQDDRVAAAAAFLPLSDNPDIPKMFGTRHRAAVGISEVTDALTIVVSEETGAISFTKDGKLITGMTHDEYRKFLFDEMGAKTAPKKSFWQKLLSQSQNKSDKGDQE